MAPMRSSCGRLVLSLLCLVFLVSFSQRSGADAQQPTPIHQLRIYEIFDHNKQAFHDRFRQHAVRIMAKYDFRIVAMWEAKTADRTEFVYLLEWSDRPTMQDRWARFMADQEWSEIKRQSAKDHGRLVSHIEERFLQTTDYSPRTTLLNSAGR
ncbi:MAG: NIPSNAP family protein [Steroidobacter sp.]